MKVLFGDRLTVFLLAFSLLIPVFSQANHDTSNVFRLRLFVDSINNYGPTMSDTELEFGESISIPILVNLVNVYHDEGPDDFTVKASYVHSDFWPDPADTGGDCLYVERPPTGKSRCIDLFYQVQDQAEELIFVPDSEAVEDEADGDVVSNKERYRIDFPENSPPGFYRVFFFVEGPEVYEYRRGMSDHIEFTVDEPVIIRPPFYEECCSNVAFLHGIKGSRLYQDGLIDDSLWLPSHSGEILDLVMDSNGESISDSIVVGDTIESVPLRKFYEPFFEELDVLKSIGDIDDWDSIEYDWRYGPFDVVDNEVKARDGNNYYLTDRIQELASTSQTGKVTLITHSNGGLVGKALMIRLEEQGLGHLVDEIIMVAAPQYGTPQAIGATIHGLDEGVNIGIYNLLKESDARVFAHNLPNAYNLMPSEYYLSRSSFSNTGDFPLEIRFPDIPQAQFLRSEFGESIGSVVELEEFLNNGFGITPEKEDVYTPLPINDFLYDKSKQDHELIDSWEAPDDVEFNTLVGHGLETVSGWEYRSKLVNDGVFGDTKFILEPYIITGDGDEVVIKSSAESSNNIYFDHSIYLSDTGIESSHSNIFSLGPVIEYLINKIEDVGDLPEYISDTYEDNRESKTVISALSPVSLLAEDSLGNKTGVDSSGDLHQEISGSQYLTFADADYLILPSGINPEVSFMARESGPVMFGLQIDGSIPVFSHSYNAHSGDVGNLNLSNDQVLVDSDSLELIIKEIVILESDVPMSSGGGRALPPTTSQAVIFSPSGSGEVKGVSTDMDTQLLLRLIMLIMSSDLPKEVKSSLIIKLLDI